MIYPKMNAIDTGDTKVYAMEIARWTLSPAGI
jgi:hypothetical protein